MKDPNNPENIRLNQAIVDAIDKALAGGDWDSSAYLRATKAKLLATRDDLAGILAEVYKQQTELSAKKAQIQQESLVDVYVIVYLLRGIKVNMWEAMLPAFCREQQYLNRPVYAEQEHALNYLRNKADKIPNACVVASINKNLIIKPYQGRPLKDSFGNDLLTLKEGALKLQDLKHFIHLSLGEFNIKNGDFV